MDLVVTNQAESSDDDFVIEKTREFNSQFAENSFEPISVFIRDDGEIIAGLTSKIYWDWLHIEYIWVSENHRHKSLGTKLVVSAEKEAIRRGCSGSTLDTFSFQALGFYKKIGYQEFGKINDYSGGHQRFYLKKYFKE